LINLLHLNNGIYIVFSGSIQVIMCKGTFSVFYRITGKAYILILILFLFSQTKYVLSECDGVFNKSLNTIMIKFSITVVTSLLA